MDDGESRSRAGWTAIGFYEPDELLQYDGLWDKFDEKFDLRPSGGKPAPVIRDPSPSVTFDLRGHTDGASFTHAVSTIQAEMMRALAADFPEEEVIYVLDWQHPAYELRPSVEAAEKRLLGAFDGYPTVYPNGDYYAYLTPDFESGSFGNPWEPSLCVFGERMIESLGRPLATWLPILRSVGLRADWTA